MRHQVFLITLAVILAVLAALPLMTKARSVEEEGGAAATSASSWPCCNQCGICNRKMPPECLCLDISYQGCNPACTNCVKYTATDDDEPPVYRCADWLTNFCERRCTPTAAATMHLNE